MFFHTKRLKIGLVLCITVALFFLKLHPVTDYETFVNTKNGETVLTTGEMPPKFDRFSWSAQGRIRTDHKWLTEATFALMHSIGGLSGIIVFVALSYSIFFLLVVSLFVVVLKRDMFSSISLGLFLCALVYDIFVARSQVFDYVFLVSEVFLVAGYMLSKKSLLWKRLLFLLVPINYIWACAHGGFIISVVLLGSYCFLFALFSWKKTQEKVIHLFSVSGLVIIATLLPPQFYYRYALLWHFAREINLPVRFIQEWKPVLASPFVAVIYSCFCLIIISFVLFQFLKRMKHKEKDALTKMLLILPLIGMVMVSFTALRHIALGDIALLIMLGFFLPQRIKKDRVLKLLFVFLIVFSLCFMLIKREFLFASAFRIPTSGTTFLAHHTISGRMFNQSGVGSYLTYKLFPKYLVYMTSEAEEVYRCCEMPELLPLLSFRDNRSRFFAETESLLKKKHISYVVSPGSQPPFLTTVVAQKLRVLPLPEVLMPFLSIHSDEVVEPTKIIADLLLDDPAWHLIYVDDQMEILVKDDGKNTKLIKRFGMSAITPFRLSQYRFGKIDQALAEYKKMIKVTDSGVSRTALGQMYLVRGELQQAKNEFQRAIMLNPYVGFPYVGLGTIALHSGDKNQALLYAKKAMDISPTLGNAYVLLGTVYAQNGDFDKLDMIKKVALKNNIDLKSMLLLQKLGERK